MRFGQIHIERQCEHVHIIRGYEQGRTFEAKDPYILRADIVQELDDSGACEIKAVMVKEGWVELLCRLPVIGYMFYFMFKTMGLIDLNDKREVLMKCIAAAASLGYERIWITRDKPVKGAELIDGRWLTLIINCKG